MLVVLSVGRWLLPKGDLSREQLSSLLLSYLAIASDIVDFIGVTEEDDDLKENKAFVYSVLTLWTWSLMQFPFVTSMQTQDGSDSDEEEEDEESAFNLKHQPFTENTEKAKESLSQRIKKQIHWLLQTEGWVICLSMFLQDGPFLIVRLIAVFKYQVLTESNYFFISKNVLTLLLQMYRLYSLYHDHVEMVQRKKKLRHQLLMNTLYRWAFVYGKVWKSRANIENPHSQCRRRIRGRQGIQTNGNAICFLTHLCKKKLNLINLCL